MMPRAAAAVAAALLALALAAPAAAGEVDKTVSFALDQWIPLDSTDGPLTLHRIRLARHGSEVKSRLMRPGNSQYLEDVQIQVEFSNAASKDWEMRLDVEWLDGDGRVIDGYDDTENLDSDSHFDQQTVTLSTLRYGLERARKLHVRITYYPG
jgi:hypothetical protein